jgi:hypothetical protein
MGPHLVQVDEDNFQDGEDLEIPSKGQLKLHNLRIKQPSSEVEGSPRSHNAANQHEN